MEMATGDSDEVSINADTSALIASRLNHPDGYKTLGYSFAFLDGGKKCVVIPAGEQPFTWIKVVGTSGGSNLIRHIDERRING
jgi:hypothetical protein